jgi:hypothetical protein
MKTIFTPILAIVLLTVSISTTSAGTLDAELDYKIHAICQYLKGKQYTSVSMLPIGGISVATGTNRIGAMMQEKFAANGIEMVGSGAPVQLDIEISLGLDDARLLIEIGLKTDRGQKLRDWTGEFEYEIGGKEIHVEVDKGYTIAEVDYADDVQKILALPFADHNLPIEAKRANRVKLHQIAEAYDDPKSYIKEDVKVSSHESGLYQMEIVTTHDPRMAANSYQSVTSKIQGKFPFVNLVKGDMIGVRLYNHDIKPVAVEVCLDGISAMFFSTLKVNHFMVPPKSSILVRGFHQGVDPTTKLHHYKHFQIVDYSNSAWLQAQQAGFTSLPESSQGSIAAHFSRERPRDRSGNNTNQDLIGQGADFTEKAKVQAMRIGPVCETIVVHYRKP